MTPASTAQALRTCASGIYTAEAAVGMLIAHAAWLDRDDLTQFIHANPSAGMAAVDWPAVVTALTSGQMPSSNGEQKMLRMAASLAGQTPVILADTITGLHASGQRQFPPAPMIIRKFRE